MFIKEWGYREIAIVIAAIVMSNGAWAARGAKEIDGKTQT